GLELLEPRLVPDEWPGVVAPETRARQLLVPLEEVGDVLARLVQRLLLRRRGIDRNTQAYVAVARMPGLAPRLAVRVEIHAQLGEVDVAQPDEEPEPVPADPRKRLGRVGGHAERRIRLLHGRRRHDGILHREELALVAKALALPRLAHDGQRLLEARGALTVGNAEPIVRARAAAAADAEVEAALAQVIDGRDFFGA